MMTDDDDNNPLGRVCMMEEGEVNNQQPVQVINGNSCEGVMAWEEVNRVGPRKFNRSKTKSISILLTWPPLKCRSYFPAIDKIELNAVALGPWFILHNQMEMESEEYECWWILKTDSRSLPFLRLSEMDEIDNAIIDVRRQLSTSSLVSLIPLYIYLKYLGLWTFYNPPKNNSTQNLDLNLQHHQY